MTNLLAETIQELTEKGLGPGDVHFVMLGRLWITWGEFAEIAQHVNYDSGFGSAKIRGDLKVVGRDWWFDRGEYDGSEWWSFCRRPERENNCHFPSVTEKDLRAQ